MTYPEAVTALEAVYAWLPAISCQRLCQRSCGVIVMARLEWIRITRKLGYKPKGKPSLVCPMLKQGKCSVHQVRPTVCRLYGLIETGGMRCAWGCIPERWVTMQEGFEWLAAVETISQQLFPAAEVTAPAYGLKVEDIAAYIETAQRKGQGGGR